AVHDEQRKRIDNPLPKVLDLPDVAKAFGESGHRVGYCTTEAEPPAFSIFSFALALNPWAVTVTATDISPPPRILTRSVLPMTPPSRRLSGVTLPASNRPDSTRAANASTFTALYSLRKRFLKPNLGNRRCSGI